MKKTTLLVLSCLAGCASSSGVLQAGPDTYSINTSASLIRGGMAGAKKEAYDAANHECSTQNKEMLVVSESATRPSFTDGMHTVDLRFKCQIKTN